MLLLGGDVHRMKEQESKPDVPWIVRCQLGQPVLDKILILLGYNRHRMQGQEEQCRSMVEEEVDDVVAVGNIHLRSFVV
jgi:hypothetical protein